MGLNPLPIIAIITLTLVFEGMLFGEELAQKSFPTLIEPEYEEGDCGFTCIIARAAAFVVNIVLVVWGGLVFLINLITFNVPDAPWFVRVPLGAIMGGGIFLAAIAMLRGN